MGSSASKPARQLGKEAASSAQSLRNTGVSASRPAGAQPTAGKEPGGLALAATPPPQRPPTFGDRAASRREGGAAQANLTGARGAEASETKSQVIRDDAHDPQLLANLQKIGQVQVPRGRVQYQPSNEMLSILAARQQDTEKEDQAHEAARQASGGVQRTGQVPNRLNSSAIVSLLDARKQCTTRRDIEELAVAYDIDVPTIDVLARFVNAPSVAAGARLRQAKQRDNRVEEGDDAPPRIDGIWTEPVLEDQKGIPGHV